MPRADDLTLESLEWSSGHNSRSSRAKTTPAPIRSVAQTALDCIVAPSTQILISYVAWTNRFRSDAAYTEDVLRERLTELDEVLIPKLEAQLWSPPPEWTGADWEKAWTLRQKRQGQRWAIREWLRTGRRPILSERLETLAEDVGSISAPGSNPFTSSVDPSTGSVCLGVAERAAARASWQRLLRQWARFSERVAYLYDHPDDPDCAALDERAFRSAVRFTELRRELAEWSGAPEDELNDLLVDVILNAPSMAEVAAWFTAAEGAPA